MHLLPNRVPRPCPRARQGPRERAPKCDRRHRAPPSSPLDPTVPLTEISAQIYSGEAMAESLQLLGRKAGGVDEAADLKRLTPKARPSQSGFIPSPTVRVISDVNFGRTETCERCGSLTSQALCQACVLLESLNKGVAKTGLEQAGV